MPEEEDAFWSLVYIMFDKQWRDIFSQTSNKIAKLLTKLENHIEVFYPDLWHHFKADEYMSMEAAFSSQIITLFIYDATPEVAIRIFEMFLLEGA
jgi:hypothetical protein